MTAPDDLTARARRLVAAATPGPWAVEGPDDDLWVMNAGRSYSVAMLGSRAVADEVDANAALIAAAPTLIADLADEVDRLRAERDRLHEEAVGIMRARADHHPFVDSTVWALIEGVAAARLIDGEAPT